MGPGQVPREIMPRLVAGDGKPLRVIDVHAHIIIPEVETLTKDRPERAGERELRIATMGEASVEYNTKVMMPASFPGLTKTDVRLADMDRMGVDMQVVSPSPNQYHYWADPDLGAELVRLQNDRIAELCAAHPDRFVGLGAVALQHPELAARQVHHAVMELGFKGVEISTQIDGCDLSDRRFDPFWAAAEALGAAVFIHPMGCSLGERLAPAYLSNTVGQPVETATALSHLIFGGVLDRQPGLKIIAAHGGGYLPTYIGRADHAWLERSDACTCHKKPSEYLKCITFDSLVYDGKVLGHLIAAAGVDQVVIGTDYPFDMGHYAIADLLTAVPELTEDERRKILGGNLERLLGLA